MNAAERLLSKGDIALYCRPTLSDSPLEREYRLFLIAWSGAAFVVKKQNPLEGLTIDQLREIYLGRISTWGEVGGGKGKIRLLERPVSLRDSPTITGVDYVARALLFNNLNVPSQAETLPSTDDIIKEVDRSPNTIAAVPLVDARDSDVKILRINGFYPTKENIMSGKYPFPRPLYIASYGEPSGALRGFIKFVLSKEGQETLSKSGLINLKEGEILSKSFPGFTGDARFDV
jgi:phosphate transport system substrate-binding protein